MTGRLRRSVSRLLAMAWKETLHVRRDPRTLVLAIVMPVVLLLLFGYGVSLDVDRIPLGVLDGDRSAASRGLVEAFTAAGEFERVPGPGAAKGGVDALFRRNGALAVLVVPAGFERDLARHGTGRAQILVDGADPTTANQVLAKADAIARAESLRLARLEAPSLRPAIEVRVSTRYNPAARSTIFLVPGLAAYLLAIGAVMLTALTVAAEWERGSMEQLFAAPVGRLEIVAGKLLPYLALGLVQLLLVLVVGSTAFDVPIRGSIALVFALGFFFLVGMLGQGLLVSVLARNQLVATQAGTLSALLPSMMLSGMVFPLENMPVALQWISRVIPARYLVHGLRGILLKGNGLGVVWPDLAALAVFAVGVIAISVARFRRRVA